MSPHAGVTVGLQLLPDRECVGLPFTSTLPGRLQLSRNARKRLNVMADLVGDDVGLREVSWCAESIIEFPEEGQIEIDLAVAGAVERAHGRLTEAAGGLRGASEENEHRRFVLFAALCEHTSPRHLCVAEHNTHEFGLRVVGGGTTGGDRVRGRTGAVDQIDRVLTGERGDQEDQYQSSQAATDGHSASGHASAIFDVLTSGATSPLHGSTLQSSLNILSSA